MAQFDWSTGELPGSTLKDANGNEITRVISCDTETGYVFRINDLGERESIYFDFPLEVEFDDGLKRNGNVNEMMISESEQSLLEDFPGHGNHCCTVSVEAKVVEPPEPGVRHISLDYDE